MGQVRHVIISPPALDLLPSCPAEAARTPLPKSPPSASQAAPNNGAPSPGDRDGDPAATPGAGSPGGQPLQFSFGGLSPSSPFSFGSPENTRDGGIGGSGRGQGGAPTAPAPGIPFASPASGGVTRQDPSQSDRWQASAGGMAGAAGGAEGGGFAAGGGSPGAPSGPFAQSGLGGILFRNEVSHAKSQDVQGGFGSRTGGDGMDEEDRSAAGQSGRNGDSGDGVAWGAGTAGEQGMGDNKGWNGGGFAAPREGGARERAERVREAAPRGAGPWATGFSVGAGKKPVSGRMRTSGRGRGGLRSAPK